MIEIHIKMSFSQVLMEMLICVFTSDDGIVKNELGFVFVCKLPIDD